MIHGEHSTKAAEQTADAAQAGRKCRLNRNKGPVEERDCWHQMLLDCFPALQVKVQGNGQVISRDWLLLMGCYEFLILFSLGNWPGLEISYLQVLIMQQHLP